MGERLPEVVIVELVGEPFLSAAKAYIGEFSTMVRVWNKFANELGATGIPGTLSGLNFERPDRKPPEGWTKPARKTGYSRPKPGHADNETIAALPKKPDNYAVFGSALIFDIRYRVPDGGWGTRGLGYLFDGPSIGWTGGGRRIIARIPHAGNAAANDMRQYEGCTIEPVVAVGWTVPPGLREITEAEHDLIFAQAKVDDERAARSTPTLENGQ